MRIICYGLTLVIFVVLALALASPYQLHQIEFISEACIIPQQDYDYRTCETISVKIDGELYDIPENFETDLASIPRSLWWVIAPQYTEFVLPSILHDYLYSCSNYGNRKWADEVLYSALLANNVSKFTAIQFYLAVRIFGGHHYETGNNFCKRNINGYFDS